MRQPAGELMWCWTNVMYRKAFSADLYCPDKLSTVPVTPPFFFWKDMIGPSMYRPAKNYSDWSFSRWIYTNPDLKISAIHLHCKISFTWSSSLSAPSRLTELFLWVWFWDTVRWTEKKALTAQHVALMWATKWAVVQYQVLPWLCIRADYRAGRHPQTWSQHPLFSSHNWGMEGSPVWWPASTGAARQNKGTQLLESYSLWNLAHKKGNMHACEYAFDALTEFVCLYFLKKF